MTYCPFSGPKVSHEGSTRRRTTWANPRWINLLAKSQVPRIDWQGRTCWEWEGRLLPAPLPQSHIPGKSLLIYKTLVGGVSPAFPCQLRKRHQGWGWTAVHHEPPSVQSKAMTVPLYRISGEHYILFSWRGNNSLVHVHRIIIIWVWSGVEWLPYPTSSLPPQTFERKRRKNPQRKEKAAKLSPNSRPNNFGSSLKIHTMR